MDKYKQLEKSIEQLIIKDELILEQKSRLTDVGLVFSKNEIHLEIDYTSLESELFINMQLKESKRFLQVFNIESIDFTMSNFEFNINDVTFLEDENESKFISLKKQTIDEEKESNTKRNNSKQIRKIEDEINTILADLKEEYIKLGSKIDDLLVTNFSDFIEDDTATFKEKMGNFIKSFKTRRTKAFVKSIIVSGIKSKRKEHTNKINSHKAKIMKKFFMEDGVPYSEWGDYFRARTLYREQDKSIKKLLSDMKNYLDDIVDDCFIDIARETFELDKNFKYAKDEDSVIEVDKRILLNETWKETKVLFNRLGLNQNEFRSF